MTELRDRFGPPPEGVGRLLRAAALKHEAEKLRMHSITARDRKLALRLRSDSPVEPERLIAVVGERGDMHFSPQGVLTVEGVDAGEAIAVARRVIAALGGDPSSESDGVSQ